MTLTLRQCALVLTLLAAPVTAVSQEATQETEAPTEESAASTEDAAAPAEPAEPITEENATVGQVYVKETHGDWTVRCARAELGRDDRCEMIVVIFNPLDEPVSEFIISKAANDDIVALATLRTPLEVVLPPGIEIGVDGNPAGRVPFLFCTPRFCQSEIQMRDKDVGVFKRGNAASMNVVVRSNPPQRVKLDVSLQGFTKAFDSLPTPAAPPAEGEAASE